MTLSNFNWTDKQTVKWFVMVTTGHEGPYSLQTLIERYEQGKISKKTQVWAEGLPGFVSAEKVLFREVKTETLPPLPIDELPPIPDIPPSAEDAPKGKVFLKRFPVLLCFVGIFLFLLTKQWLTSQAKFTIHRQTKMDPQLFQRINNDFKFASWDKEIFFKEYLSTDLTHIWLVNGGFQHCQVEATFSSLPEKLLSLESEKVSMKSKGVLKGHVVEFSRFDFKSGSKIIPGLYELDVKASHCKWDGLAPKLGNYFSGPEESYVARTKVVLYPGGTEAFYKILEKLSKKKTEIIKVRESEEELFWQDLQQKLQTLVAITLQVEQYLLDFLEKNSSEFHKNLKPMVDKYTAKYGHVLTKFVVANENYFKDLKRPHLKELARKKDYEMMVRYSAKHVGLETMKIIETLQSLKNPPEAKLKKVESDVRTSFKKLKEELNGKIIQVSEDRSL